MQDIILTAGHFHGENPCNCACGTDCTCLCMTCHGETNQTNCIHGPNHTAANVASLAL